MHSQRGVALVQVLLVTVIIMLLVTQLSLTAADQVRKAQAMRDRSEAELYLASREAALLYTLLTEPLAPAPGAENPYAANWNFHGEPFAVDGLEISLQDQSGLMRFPVAGVAEFRDLLETLGLGPSRARDLAQRLAHWLGITLSDGGPPSDAMMRGDTGGPLQYLGELLFLDGMNEQLYWQLAGLMTLYPTPGFNPLTAPRELLRTMMPESTLKAVLEARFQGELDQNRLWDMARIGADEYVVPTAGPGFSIRLTGEYRGVALTRQVVVGVMPYEAMALTVWGRERFAGGIPK